MKIRLAAAALLVPFSLAQAQLMVPDSGVGDRIMLFNSQDGSLIDVNWITDAGAVGWEFTTPKEAAIVANQIWVSDQVADAVHRFDLNRNFLGTINTLPGGLPAANFDNLRGFGVSPDGGSVYLTMFHGNTALRGYVTIDTNALQAVAFTATPPNTTSLFDAEVFQGELLTSTSTTDAIQRRNLADGSLIGNFATLVDPQQITINPDGSVMACATITTPAAEGIYHYNSDGSLRRFLATEAIKVATAELVPRGAYILGNGDYFLTTSIGVFTLRPTGPGPTDYTFTEIIRGVDAQYVNAIPEPTSLALFGGLAALAMVRRRD